MNTPTLPVLTGTAVTLRPITDADTDLIVKWRNTPSVVQNFIFRQTFTPEMHRSWLATKVATGQVVQYIILDNADGKPVELEGTGLLHTQRTAGRFVTEDTAVIQSAKEELARSRTREYLESMAQLGYDRQQVKALLEETPAADKA